MASRPTPAPRTMPEAWKDGDLLYECRAWIRIVKTKDNHQPDLDTPKHRVVFGIDFRNDIQPIYLDANGGWDGHRTRVSVRIRGGYVGDRFLDGQNILKQGWWNQPVHEDVVEEFNLGRINPEKSPYDIVIKCRMLCHDIFARKWDPGNDCGSVRFYKAMIIDLEREGWLPNLSAIRLEVVVDGLNKLWEINEAAPVRE